MTSWPQFGVPAGLFLANLSILAFSIWTGAQDFPLPEVDRPCWADVITGEDPELNSIGVISIASLPRNFSRHSTKGQPISYGRRPGHSEDAIIFDRELEFQPLAPFAGVACKV